MKIKERLKIAPAVWGRTFGILRKNPNVLIPFLIAGLFDALILALIYLAPRPPLSDILAPPIRAFWGEKFLHYPFNLLLIPKLFNYAHIISTAVIGVLMTGLAIGILSEIKEGIKPHILTNLIRSAKRYLTLLAIWLIIFGLVTLVFKAPQFLHLKQKFFLPAFYISFLFAVLIEVIFIYAMPAVIIEKKRLLPAIKRSLSFSRSVFLPSLILVMIPSLIFIPMILLRGKLVFLMSRFFPEVVLIVLGLGIIVSVIIDCLVTCSTVVLFLNQKEFSRKI